MTIFPKSLQNNLELDTKIDNNLLDKNLNYNFRNLKLYIIIEHLDNYSYINLPLNNFSDKDIKSLLMLLQDNAHKLYMTLLSSTLETSKNVFKTLSFKIKDIENFISAKDIANEIIDILSKYNFIKRENIRISNV